MAHQLRIPLFVAVAIVVVLLAALWLTTLLPIADPLPPPLQGWRTVGSYFDRPPAWPGKPWSYAGHNVDSDVLTAVAGPSHCNWDSATFLTIGWPPGTGALSSSESRQYLRDPTAAVPSVALRGSWMKNPLIPHDANDSGYTYGALKLVLAPSDQDAYVYVVSPRDSERWPRSDPQTTCS